MNNFDFLNDYYNPDGGITDNELYEMLIHEFDLSSVGDVFKDKLQSIKSLDITSVYKKIDNKLHLKLKEFDIDSENIKRIAKKTSKSFYNDIHNGFVNKVPSKQLAKKIDKKIMASITSELRDSSLTAIGIIGSLILAFTITIFVMTILLGILHIILGFNLLLSYLFILMFFFEIYGAIVYYLIEKFDSSALNDTNVASFGNKLKNTINFKKMDENTNEKIYMVKTFSYASGNILSKLKIS